METIISKIDNGNDDADWNSLTGTSIQRGFVKIGKWATVNSYGLFRFMIPINRGITIKKAVLTIYINEYKDFLEKDQKPVEVLIDISDEINAKSLEFGANRAFITSEKYRKKLNVNSFVYFDVTKHINKIINKKKWEKNNYVLLRMKINKVNNQLWNITSVDNDLFGAAQIIMRTNDTFNEITEEIIVNDKLICLNSDLDNFNYKIGDLIIHPNHISCSGDSIIRSYQVIAPDQLSIKISEKINYEQAKEMLNLVGQTMPFLTPEYYFNCIVQSVSLNYNIRFVDTSLNLVIF